MGRLLSARGESSEVERGQGRLGVPVRFGLGRDVGLDFALTVVGQRVVCSTKEEMRAGTSPTPSGEVVEATP